ncbi:MAG: type secretion protein [Bacillota bacterium]|jgi:flagellar biosynthetic protein FliR|nr:type secretion protein [Bacillota bacterium]
MTFNGDFTYFLLILARMSGCIFFNPIFGRNSIPAILKTSLTVLLSATVYGLLPLENDLIINTVLEYAIIIIKELFIGYLIGFIISMFFSVVVIAGEIIDMQIGMSMSQIYDPSSNMSMGISGSFLNIFTMILFFSAGGHLSLIEIFITSFKLIKIGVFLIPTDLFLNMVELLSQILTYALKLSLPIIAVEIIIEAGMGILMKAIPQIQVFSVNVQLKLMVGMFLMVILVPTFSAFLQNMMTIMFDNIRNNLSLLMT